MDLMEKALMEHMCKDIDGISFYLLYRRGGKNVQKLIGDVKEVISEHELTVSEIKGFLEFMKIVADSNSYLPK